MGVPLWAKWQSGDCKCLATIGQQRQIPTFEQLEPRILLSADLSPLQDIHSLEIYEEQIVSVDIGEVASSELRVARDEGDWKLEVGSEKSENREQEGQGSDEFALEASMIGSDSSGEELSSIPALGNSEITVSDLQLQPEKQKLRSNARHWTSRNHGRFSFEAETVKGQTFSRSDGF